MHIFHVCALKHCSAPAWGCPELLAAQVSTGMVYPKHVITLHISSTYHKHNLREDRHLPSHSVYDLGEKIYPGCLDTPRTVRPWHLGMP